MKKRYSAALLWLALATPVQAQQLVRTFGQDSTRMAPRHALIRVGKWLTLGAAAGAAAYGIIANRDADRRYDALERLCQSNPDRCARQSANGAFSDLTLEQEYQEILALDSRAKLALVAGNVAVAASVALFILDLPRGPKGEDIPYSPPRLEAYVSPLGRVGLQVRYTH
jgi:hypothetical protein